MVVTEAEVIRQFLDLQYGTDKGTAWISVGGGAKTEKTFSENPFQWPEQAQDVVDFVVARICDQLGIEQALTNRWGETT